MGRKRDLGGPGLGLTVLAGALFLAACSPLCAGPIFINEFHYDNTGTDTGEAIEVAGPAGFDLTGWSIVFYNGSGGATYNSVALTGLLPDQQSGFGTASFGVALFNLVPQQIQNGAPDGFALIDPLNNVAQFLSYEGSFMATDGPASGMMSTDIGVLEVGSEPIGLSLQLTGTGMSYEDFTWSGPVAQTFGAVNAGQTFVPEPSMFLPLGLALGLLAARRRRG